MAFGEPALSPNVKGQIAELTAATDLLRRGWDVYKSVSHTGTCDLIAIRRSNEVLRVEVKSTETGKVHQVLSKLRNTGKCHLFDVLAFVNVRLNRVTYYTWVDDSYRDVIQWGGEQ